MPIIRSNMSGRGLFDLTCDTVVIVAAAVEVAAMVEVAAVAAAHLLLLVAADAHLDIHQVGVGEAEEEVVELEILLPVLLGDPVEGGRER